MVGFVAALTVVLFVYLLTVTQRLNSEIQSRNLARLERTLEESALSNALSIGALTANAVLNPLYFEDIEGVGGVLIPLAEDEEVLVAKVYSRDGKVFHDGTEEIKTFGDLASEDVMECLRRGESKIELRPNDTIHIISPVIADGYRFGILEIILDAAFIDGHIAEVREELATAAERETGQQFRELVLLALIALVAAAILAAVLAGRLSAPIRRLADATAQVSEGNFRVEVLSKRGDELGDLAESFSAMALRLRENMVSRTELQKTVEEQTRELRRAHESLLALETDRRDVLEEIADDLHEPFRELESDAEHALRNYDSALELRHSMSLLLMRLREIRGLLDDLRFANRSDEPRRAARRQEFP